LRENLDRKLWKNSAFFCGVDEVGRGALAGPVVAAAVVLRPGTRIPGVDDSKKLSPDRRRRFEVRIKQRCLAWSIGAASHRYIDRHNIHSATFHAMRLAVNKLPVRPAMALADGWPIPGLDIPCTGVIGGDGRSLSIACASILAKVFRDGVMERLGRRYPGYGMERHKGYGTAEHLRAISLLGASPVHRRSFQPLSRCALPQPS